MKARKIFSLTASILMTGATLSLFTLPTTPLLGPVQANVSMINGIPVFDLPGITVQPTDAERRAAALPDHRRVAGAALLQGLTGDSDGGSVPLSSSLTMPYYSFASEIGQISKD